MNMKNLLIATALGGLVSIILSNVPVLNLINILLCAGFWLGPMVAVWLYKRLGGTFTLGRAVLIGALAGVWAGIFGLILSVFDLAGFESLMQTYRRYAPPDANIDLPPQELSAAFNVCGVVFDVIMGAIGGLIGGALWRTKAAAPATAA